MDPKLLILIALTDGRKTFTKLWEILRQCTYAYDSALRLRPDIDLLERRCVVDGVEVPPMIRLLHGEEIEIELTSKGNVWLSSRPVIRFIVDRMNAVERHGLPRD